MGRSAANLQGLTFGYLRVLAREGSDDKGKATWKLRCVCGKEVVRSGRDFARPRYKNQSCGCMRRHSIAQSNTKHGMSAHPVYAVWRSMLARCNNPKHPAYHNYGGRGIRVCTRWTSFGAFWSDMKTGYVAGRSLDRIDNQRGYSPKNCRWASMKQQANNTRFNRRIPTPWGLLTVQQASEKSGIGHTTLLYRVHAGVPKARLFDKPDFTNRFSK